jgi:Zn-finger nucleic acid-binding protein
LKCPRDANGLHRERQHGIEIDVCKTCRGAWYDFEDLAALERTAARDDSDLAGTVEYSKRPSELACPVCEATMVAFDYRAHNLELDACDQEHGFWLDAGESERARRVIEERVRNLDRSALAESRWNRSREAGFTDSVIDRMRDLFRRR